MKLVTFTPLNETPRVGARVGDQVADLSTPDRWLAGTSSMNNPQSSILHPLFRGLDHLAVVVLDTEKALKLWRDQFGFPVLFTETVNQGSVRLTHLDLGNTHLQLVEPLTSDHPLQAWLAKNGAGLHHFCLKVDDVDAAAKVATGLGLRTAPKPHQGTQGKRAVFLDKTNTQGVQVELTGS